MVPAAVLLASLVVSLTCTFCNATQHHLKNLLAI